jgi:hypothetical protein
LENKNGQFYIRNTDKNLLAVEGDKLIWKNHANDNETLWNIQTLHHAPNDFKQGFSAQGTQGQGYNNGQLHGYLFDWVKNLNQNVNNNNQGNFPTQNEEFAIIKNGKYVGFVAKHNETVKLAPNNDTNEKFFLERHPDGTFSFRQKISGLFLGGEINNNKSPKVVKQA